jgi:hypothetical protein
MTDQPGSETPESGSGSPAQPPYPGQSPYPGQGPYPGQQQYPGQQYPGQQPYPGQQQYPGYAPQGSPYPGQQAPYPGQQQPGYGYPGYPGYPGAPGGQPKRGFSGWAIAAFVTGLIPVIGIFAAIPLAIVALVKISRHRDRGKWMAITGLVVSGLYWVGLFAIGIWVETTAAHRNDAGVITEAGRLDFGDVRRGDCVKIPGLQNGDTVGAFDITGVPCADEHNAQAIYVVTFPDSDYPGEAVLQQKTAQACGPQYLAEGIQPAGKFYLYPTEKRWGQSNGHRAICFVTDGGRSMTGSAIN